MFGVPEGAKRDRGPEYVFEQIIAEKRERQRQRQRKKQSPCRETDVGFDPGSLGSRLGQRQQETTEQPGCTQYIFLTYNRLPSNNILFRVQIIYSVLYIVTYNVPYIIYCIIYFKLYTTFILSHNHFKNFVYYISFPILFVFLVLYFNSMYPKSFTNAVPSSQPQISNGIFEMLLCIL